jgi:hypothetical protein
MDGMGWAMDGTQESGISGEGVLGRMSYEIRFFTGTILPAQGIKI